MPSVRLTLAGVLAGSCALVGAFVCPALASTPPIGVPAPPVPPATVSAPSDLGTLAQAHPVLTFTGTVTNPTPLPLVNDPSPAICAAECQEYQFTDHAPGTPFLAAVKSTIPGTNGTFNADQGLDLYVYDPSGKLVGSQNGVGANGQSVVVSPTMSGVYKVIVTFTYAYDAGSGWQGEIRLMTPTSWRPAPATCGITVSGSTGCYELPALRVLPAYDLTASGVPPVVSTPLGFPLPLSTPMPTSCYADETVGLDNPSVGAVTNPVTRCLRFTTDIQNVGAGPLAVGIPLAASDTSGQPEIGYLPGDCHAIQRVTAANGNTVARPAGNCEFHVEHGHFHYDALLGYSLHSANADGSIGPAVSVSTKESFCLSDDDYFGFGTAGPNGPRRNVGQPDCNLPRQVSPPSATPGSGTYVDEGITPGWGDVYTWDTPDQYINVTDVPSGTYWIVEETNPTSTLLVSGPAQTCAATELQLTRGQQSDTVKQLATVADVSCPA